MALTEEEKAEIGVVRQVQLHTDENRPILTLNVRAQWRPCWLAVEVHAVRNVAQMEVLDGSQMLLQVSVMGECRSVILDGSQDAFAIEEPPLLFNSSTTVPTINLAVLDDTDGVPQQLGKKEFAFDIAAAIAEMRVKDAADAAAAAKMAAKEAAAAAKSRAKTNGAAPATCTNGGAASTPWDASASYGGVLSSGGGGGGGGGGGSFDNGGGGGGSLASAQPHSSWNGSAVRRGERVNTFGASAADFDGKAGGSLRDSRVRSAGELRGRYHHDRHTKRYKLQPIQRRQPIPPPPLPLLPSLPPPPPPP